MIVNNYPAENKVKKIIRSIVKKVPIGQQILREREQRFINTENMKYKAQFYKNFDMGFDEQPGTVQIETINRCNGTCSFCPVNRNIDPRSTTIMSDDIFGKIIDDLRALNYSGRIGLFSNNEPLLDKQILKRVKAAREACPNSYIYFYTNGTLLDEAFFLEASKYMDRIEIDDYNDELLLSENLKTIVKLCENDEKLNDIARIQLRKENEVLFTRGGQSPNNNKRVERDYPCFLPFCQMVIRPDGKVSLCCSDALGKYTLGDVREQSILEIWNSDKYRDIRRRVLEDITSIDLCRFCDSKHLE